MITLLGLAAAYLLLPGPRRPERWVFPTPRGSQLGTRVYGSTDAQIVERLMRL
jgi:hypothetical protein